MKEETHGWSPRARFSIAVGFISGVILCAMVIRAKLAQFGCAPDMSIENYCAAGATGLATLVASFFVIAGLVMGTVSMPKWISSWRKHRAEYLPECKHRYESFKEEARIIVYIILAAIAVVVVIAVLGGLLGYVGWLFFC